MRNSTITFIDLTWAREQGVDHACVEPDCNITLPHFHQHTGGAW